MANHLRVTLEIGPKGKRVAAVAPDWPGLERGAKTEQAAIERVLAYLPRYAPVVKLAGMEAAFATSPVVDVVEHYPGTGGTDFWGISFAFSDIDQHVVAIEALERELTLMRACWTFFDAVRARVSAEMQRGRAAADAIEITLSDIRLPSSRAGRLGSGLSPPMMRC